MSLKTTAPDVAIEVMVAIDLFAHWVEIGSIPHLISHSIAFWFYSLIEI